MIDDIKKTLWTVAHKLRDAMKTAGYKHTFPRAITGAASRCVFVAVAIATLAGCANLLEFEGSPVSFRSSNGYSQVAACVFDNMERLNAERKITCTPMIQEISARKEARLWCQLGTGFGHQVYAFRHVIQQTGVGTEVTQWHDRPLINLPINSQLMNAVVEGCGLASFN